jgi:hypothetical protein
MLRSESALTINPHSLDGASLGYLSLFKPIMTKVMEVYQPSCVVLQVCTIRFMYHEIEKRASYMYPGANEHELMNDMIVVWR